jgi:hypothetical protein
VCNRRPADAQSWHLPPLPAHPNGLRFSLFNEQGDLIATNEYFSVGGGFVVNNDTQVAENMYYMGVDKEVVEPSRRDMAQGHASAGQGEAAASAGEAVGYGIKAIGSGAEGLAERGSGAIQSEAEKNAAESGERKTDEGATNQLTSGQPPFLFTTAAELHRICVDNDMTIAQVVWENEKAFRSEDEIRDGLMKREWGPWHESCTRLYQELSHR